MARKKAIQVSGDTLKTNYDKVKPLAEKFMAALCEQLESILLTHGITLGVPLERRIKSFESISGKIERNEISLRSIIDLDDFIGIRLILLFKRDLDKIHKVIMDTFDVVRYEDAGARLTETQFGYQSVHYIVKFPDSWLGIPSLSDFGDFKAEVQVRALAQHIWAATSHVLQYKQESSVPIPIKRSIYRVSAILETVDLEFERLLNERESYISEVDTSQEHAKLNVDLVKRILDELLPAENKDDHEPYGELMEELLHFDVDTVGKLRQLIQSNLTEILNEDKRLATGALMKKNFIGTSRERAERGVYFVHVGLVRNAMHIRFGDEWFEYLQKEDKKRRSSK